MSFELTFDPPGCTNLHDPLDQTLGEAIETCFDYDDKITMKWNGFDVRLSWAGDISQMWRNLLLMMRGLKSDDPFAINWPSSSFFAYWEFSTAHSSLTISAHWTAVVGGKETLQALRDTDPIVVIDRNVFVEEWRPILLEIQKNLKHCGYEVDSLYGFPSLMHEIRGDRGPYQEFLGVG